MRKNQDTARTEGSQLCERVSYKYCRSPKQAGTTSHYPQVILLSANFSMSYPLTIESVESNAPANSGVYEFCLKAKEIEYSNGKTRVIYIGSTMNVKKRLKEHLSKNSKNGQIKNFLNKYGCFFRYIQLSKNWKEEEKKLYKLFVTTYALAPECNRVSP